MADHRKNVTLLSCERAGVRSFKLLGPYGQEISSFEIFAITLCSYRWNTRKKYCAAVADFLDFFFEAFLHITTNECKSEISRGDLRDIVQAWHAYLVQGPDADNELSKLVASTLSPRLVTSETSKGKHAALIHFLRLSEQYRNQAAELVKLQLLSIHVDYEPLMQASEHFRAISLNERRQIVKSSVLGGLARQTSTLPLPLIQDSISQVGKFDIARAFPSNYFADFVSALSSFRDKALYCFYAASGCRAHEGLQLLWDDIDIPGGTVQLVSPFSRWNHSSYRNLTKKERDRLSWKGRETSDTFLIEPYVSMFFEYLEKYHRDEYYPHGRHQFVFQVRQRRNRGKPYFLTDPTTRQEVFDNAVEKSGLPIHAKGPHSLRHAYGVYLLNYMPLEDGGYGLPIGEVRIALGHSNIKSTEKYAVMDKDLVNARLQFANLQVFHQGKNKNHLDFKIKALEAQIEKIRHLPTSFPND